ncbi:hypothetical protein EDB80DRAFT_563543 [Ilyonectria destructans]|nr:hypothetical protein EDB80DRAFT_563543 [Ilyonectria destructans]
MATTSHTCSVCGRGFLRRTHLLRHEATHRSTPGHPCQFCGKSFVRSDVARRHAQSCRARNDHDAVRASKRGRRREACDYCFSHKLSCDKKKPCERCTSSGRNCTTIRVDQDPHRTQGYLVRGSAEESNRLTVSFLLNFTDPNVPSTMDSLNLQGADTTFQFQRPSWWNRAQRETDFPSTQPTEADFSLLLWGIPDPFCTLTMETESAADEEYWNLGLPPYPVRAENGQLQDRVRLLVSELQQLNHEIEYGAFLTGPNFLTHILAFFRQRHSQVPPTIHWPTFDPETISLHLLLAVALAGATLTYPRDDILSIRKLKALCETAEIFIFNNLDTVDAVIECEGEVISGATIEACQAALLIEVVQISFNCYKTRRRILSQRHTYLVAVVRSLRLFSSTHTHREERETWAEFIRAEALIRLAASAFFNDAMFVLYFNHPPSATVSEMTGDLTCDDNLWNAETEKEFGVQWALNASTRRPPRLRDLIPSILAEEWIEARGMFQDLNIHDLHLILWALQPTIFNLRAALSVASCFSMASRALERWKILWQNAMERHRESQQKSEGMIQYASGVAWLTCKILEAECNAGARGSPYFRQIGRHNAADLHQLIKEYQ